MRQRSFVILPVLVLVASLTGGAAPSIPNDERAVTHALNRLAFGPASTDVADVRRIGLAAWIDRQLHPERIDDTTLQARLARLETLTLDSAAITRDYIAPARAERRRLQQQNQAPDGGGAPMRAMRPPDSIQRARQVLTDLVEAKLLRAVYSERQLAEVLADFWFNHFNVFARKGQTERFLTEYDRDVIRPRVFGKFRDLLGATAKSPAMLFYLDNAMNGRNGSINENYARELMELHTLGVDGGYTQEDVVNVAKAFTGWSIGPPQFGDGFRFAVRLHDRSEKTVLGQTLRAGGGIEDGERVLDILASHPSTAKHIAFKLAQRFVSDAPPPALVERAAARFRDTSGDLREVTRTIISSPEFFAPAAYRAKVKTPLEFVISALRATGAEVTTALPAARALADMGMPLFLCQPPTGYDDTAEAWISSGSLVSRINFALALSKNQLRGIRVPEDMAKAVDIGAAEFQRQ
jgi:uncharacterized protein (DUF1800 family)